MKRNKRPQNKIAIEVSGVSKTFKIPKEKKGTIRSYFLNPFRRIEHEEFDALKDITFEVKKGEFVGIIGRNGSGKSTLLKLIVGIYIPNKGEILVNGRIVPFLELGVGFNMELSGRENIFLNGTILGMTRKYLQEKFNEIVDFAEVRDFIDVPLKNYSSGMQVRLAFAIAIQANADIYLLDEVLAVGDQAFQQKCFSQVERLKKQNKTILYVSHDLGSVRNYCDRVVYLKNYKIEKLGEVDSVVDYYIYEDRKIKEKQEGIPARSRKEITIEKVCFLNKHNKVSQNFVSGDSMKIVVHYKAEDTSIKDVIFGFGIYKDDGDHIFGTNTYLQDREVHLKGKGCITFIVKKINLQEGHFLVSASAHTKDNQNYDWHDKKYEFWVSNNTKSPGWVRFDIEVET